MHKVAIVLGTFLFAVVFLISFIIVRSCTELGDQIDQRGLKSVLEEIWQGKEDKP